MVKTKKLVLHLTPVEWRLLRDLIEQCVEEPADEISWLEFVNDDDLIEQWSRIAKTLEGKISRAVGE